MKIKWLGHSCFLLTSQNGTKLLTDPFDGKVGYALPSVEADVVTSSHGHYDHGNTKIVKGLPACFNTPGLHGHKDFSIKGVATFHDESGGAKRGNNIVFRIEADGIAVCHCGDLGHMLSGAQLKELMPVDILLVPVGGVFTVDAKGAYEVRNMLKPKVTIPMHYKTAAAQISIDTADKFLGMTGGAKKGKCEIEVTRSGLDDGSISGVIALNYY